jgi:uncharacterized phiE125 gp8 family phage protein
MIFDTKLITDVDKEILTLSEVKDHLYITHSDDDTYLTGLITKARKQIQNYCTIAIGSQEWVWLADFVGNVETQIPYQPVITVDDVKEKTDYGTYTSIVLHTAYDIDGENEKSFTPFYDGRFKVEYTTGYVVLPDDLKQGWLAQILYLYENRGDENKQGLSEIAKDLVAPYRDLSWV